MKPFRSLVGWLGRLQYRFFNRMRHREAFRIAAEPPEARDFSGLDGHHYCLLVTFKRTGEPVPTPIQFGVRDGKLYFRTEAGVAKLGRIHNDPRVRIAPCNWRGKPLGALAEGTARVLQPNHRNDAYAVLKSNYTLSQRLFEGMVDHLPVQMIYVEVAPASAVPSRRPGDARGTP